MPDVETVDASVKSIRESPGTHCESPGTHSSKREQHARTPDSVMQDQRLNLEAKAVYTGMARHSFKGGLVYIGQRRLAEYLGTNQKTVSRYISRLCKLGHVVMNDPIRGRRASYRLTSNIFEATAKREKKALRRRVSETAKAASNANSRKVLDEILGA